MKTCTGCRTEKPESEFSRTGVTRDGLQSWCKECKRRERYRYLYGISYDDYMRLWEQQDGKCAVCCVPDPGGRARLQVDHDHECCPGERACGQCVRGLLCLRCNLVLGLIEDDPGNIDHLIAYLMSERPIFRD